MYIVPPRTIVPIEDIMKEYRKANLATKIHNSINWRRITNVRKA